MKNIFLNIKAALLITALLVGCSEDSVDVDIRPVAAFKVNSTTIALGEQVRFTDLSFDQKGEIVSWSWDFGDGQSSSEQNPTHIYSELGSYTVQLSVIDNGDQKNSNDFSKKITVKEPADTDEEPVKLWEFTLPYFSQDASPAVSADGTVYMGSDAKAGRGEFNIHAIKNGNEVWKFAAGDVVRSTPAIAADGTMYIGAYDKNLYAFNPDGTVKWQYNIEGNAKYSSPALATDGTIYIGSTSKKLYALNPDGTLKWSFDMEGDANVTPAVAEDGTVYGGDAKGNIYAINPDGTLKWENVFGSWAGTSVAIGEDGAIYFAGENGTGGILVVYNSDGSERWKREYDEKINQGGPVLGENGVVYIGGHGKALFAYDADGNELWSFACDVIQSVPAIDNLGNIYFGDMAGTFYVLTPEGKLAYKEMSLGTAIYSSPVIGNDGTIYVSSRQEDQTGKVYALKTAASSPSLDSPWPMKSRNSVRNGNITL